MGMPQYARTPPQPQTLLLVQQPLIALDLGAGGYTGTQAYLLNVLLPRRPFAQTLLLQHQLLRHLHLPAARMCHPAALLTPVNLTGTEAVVNGHLHLLPLSLLHVSSSYRANRYVSSFHQVFMIF